MFNFFKSIVMILCNMGGDPSLEHTGGGYFLAVVIFIIIFCYYVIYKKDDTTYDQDE